MSSNNINAVNNINNLSTSSISSNSTSDRIDISSNTMYANELFDSVDMMAYLASYVINDCKSALQWSQINKSSGVEKMPLVPKKTSFSSA